jgi:hypothetical protein
MISLFPCFRVPYGPVLPMTMDSTPSAGPVPVQGPTDTAYADRLAWCYVNEGLALLGEGVPAAAIEAAALDAGLASGPLALLDTLSLEEADRRLHDAAHAVGHEDGHDHHDHPGAHTGGHDHGHQHVHGQEHARADGHDDHHGHGPHRDHEHSHDHDHDHGDSTSVAHDHGHGHPPAAASFPAPAPHGMTEEAVYVLEKMAHGFSRMGRWSGRGFYDYEDGEAPELWPGLKVFERRRTALAPEDLRDRLLFAQALAALRALEEGDVASADEADRGSLLGWGFSERSGGVVAFIEKLGLQAFSERARKLAARYGPRFEPPARFVQIAEAGESLRAQQ